LLLVAAVGEAAAQTAALHCHPAAAARLLTQLTVLLPPQPSCHRCLQPAKAALAAAAGAAAAARQSQQHQHLLNVLLLLLLVLCPRLPLLLAGRPPQMVLSAGS
jgi:hypothetical protein